MRVAMLGSGAVGGYFGARLARAGHDVTFVARGAHLKAIRERGLSIRSPLGDFTVRAEACEATEGIGAVALAVFAVKTYDNPSALPMLRPLVGPDTIVLTLQNGVDSADEIAAVVGSGHVLGGSTYIATAIAEPGVIEQTGTHRKIVFGEAFGDRSRVSARVAALADALAEADIQVETFADARVPIWQKYAYLSPFAAFTGATRLPAGRVFGDPILRAQFIEAVGEVERVARAEGVDLPADLYDTLESYIMKLPPSTRSSLLIDLSQGKRIELEALQGAVVRRGEAAGVPTPVLRTLYAVLRPYADGAP